MLCLISVFRTVRHWSAFRDKKFIPHIAKLLLQNTFQYYPSITGYDLKKSLPFRVAIQNLKLYGTQNNTKEETVKCNFIVSFLG